jgi:hypothetical protein
MRGCGLLSSDSLIQGTRLQIDLSAHVMIVLGNLIHVIAK